MAWTATGLVALFSLVLVADVTQVAVDCTLFGIYGPHGTVGGCPVLSWPTLVLLGGFAVSSGMIAIGLSRTLVVLVSASPPGGGTERLEVDRRGWALDFVGPFLAFFGWGVLAWGLTQPMFENCKEPCGYPYFPYVLEGTAFELSILGGIALALGVSVLATLANRRHRQNERGARPRVVGPNSGSSV